MTDKYFVARQLEEIGRYLELGEENKFKAIAFQNAARKVLALDVPVQDFVSSGAIDNTAGIGKATRSVIAEIVETGRSEYLSALEKRYPPGIFDLLRIPGLGLRKVEVLYAELGVSSIHELEQACRDKRISALPGFSPKSQQKLLESIEALEEKSSEHLLPYALDVSTLLTAELEKLTTIESVHVSGSVRRRLETVASLDFCVVTTDPEATAAELRSWTLFQETPEPSKRILEVSVREMTARIHMCSPPELAVVLMQTTGSLEFVERMALVASEGNLRFDGGRLVADGKPVALKDEAALFRRLRTEFVEPELREPDSPTPAGPLILPADLCGTFHVHTTYSDGRSTLYEMLDAAQTRGYQYVGISDHSKTAAYAGGLTVERLAEQQAEIDDLAPRFAPMTVFKGTEADILASGEIDYDSETLAKFDFVIASVHSRFKMAKDEMTERMLVALRNPFVTFLGHLTGRLLLSRPAYAIDMDQVFRTAAEQGVMIEINGNPRRLEIDWRLMRKAADCGVIFSIHPDAHSTDALDDVISGTNAARKGGLSPSNVFNTLDVEVVAEHFAHRRARAMKMLSRGT